jgi:DNA-binding IclR family transcriptional regulator
MTTHPPTGAPERSVVDRTLSILAVFDRDNRSLSLSDISRRSGLPVATVHRIVNKLHTWGALERGIEGRYSIGLRLWETGTLAPRWSSWADIAQPHLVSLAGQTSAAAVVMIRDGSESLSVSYVCDDQALATRWSSPGCRLPLHATAAGLVLLAHADEHLQNQICAGPLQRCTTSTITDGAALLRHLAKVRCEGHAVVYNTLYEGRGGVSAPVRNSRGAVVASVSAVANTTDAFQPRKLVPQVVATAEAITQQLRAPGARLTGIGA